MEVKPGYKQTDVGVIPKDWNVHLLSNLSVISRLAGAEYTSLWEETPNGEITALRGFNIGQGRIIERDFVRISNKLSLKLKRSRLCRGDVVYPCVGSIGNAVVIEDDAKYHIQQNIARITPDSDAIDSHYLANFLMSSLAEREVERFTSSSSQPSVLVGSLRQYRIPLPPALTEQRDIAEALKDVDGLLGGLDRLNAKKRDLKQATMQQLLTGRTRLPGFHGEWEVKELGKLGKISGAGVDKKIRLGEPPVRLVNYMDVYRRDFIYSKDLTHVVSASVEQAARCAARKGDVFFTPSSEMPFDIAVSAVAMEDIPDACYSYHVVRLRLDEDWDLNFAPMLSRRRTS